MTALLAAGRDTAKPELVFQGRFGLRTPRLVVMPSLQGKTFNQAMARELPARAPGFSVRPLSRGLTTGWLRHWRPTQISIGDYVLTNGTLAAAAVIDAVVRLLPGVLGAPTTRRTFCGNRLEYPQFTRPEVFCNLRVPDVAVRRPPGHRPMAGGRIAPPYACAPADMLRRKDAGERKTNAETFLKEQRRHGKEILKKIDQEQRQTGDIPDFKVGDSVKVYVRIKEGAANARRLVG